MTIRLMCTRHYRDTMVHTLLYTLFISNRLCFRFEVNEQTFIRVRICVFWKRGFLFCVPIIVFLFFFSSSNFYSPFISFLIIVKKKRTKDEAQKSTRSNHKQRNNLKRERFIISQNHKCFTAMVELMAIWREKNTKQNN